MPVPSWLPTPWWGTPNIHLCTVRDFTQLCDDLDLRIEACTALANGKPARPIVPQRAVENWRAESALFLLSRANAPVAASRAGTKSDLFG